MRVMVVNLNVILFDEFIFVFDLEFVGEVLSVIKFFVKEGIMMFIVIYEINFVKEVVDKIIFMDNGVIVEEGIFDEIFNNFKNERIVKFLNIIRKEEVFS